MSWRRPPGFMKAIWAAPASGDEVAQRCTSATRLPMVDSPPRFSAPLASLARLNGPASLPRTFAPSTSDWDTAGSTIVFLIVSRMATALGSVRVTVLADWMAELVSEAVWAVVSTWNLSTLKLVPYWPEETTGIPVPGLLQS